jgi:hypothetical protein
MAPSAAPLNSLRFRSTNSLQRATVNKVGIGFLDCSHTPSIGSRGYSFGGADNNRNAAPRDKTYPLGKCPTRLFHTVEQQTTHQPGNGTSPQSCWHYQMAGSSNGALNVLCSSRSFVRDLGLVGNDTPHGQPTDQRLHMYERRAVSGYRRIPC